MRVRRIDSFQVKLQGRAEVQVFLPELQRVVLHVGRRKGLAVMPGDAFAQLDGVAAEVRRRGDAKRQRGLEFQVGIQL
ncbi:hypothetical protein G6F59_018771 [Rhizopus arrhizus]|nr:hypothetical protein G6F59_018771 [Rhizopus arrhizus]